MSGDKLTTLQWRILEVLAGIEPGWTLTGGGALAGFYLKHRTTKDLGLFWHGQHHLGDLPREVRDRLTNKLCALLGRAEIRDLVDVQALLASGADLKKALLEAPRKDAGFSPLPLAWVLRDIRPKALGHLAGLSEEEAKSLENFKERLVIELLEASAPEQA
jgi:hypothetical protein